MDRMLKATEKRMLCINCAKEFVVTRKRDANYPKTINNQFCKSCFDFVGDYPTESLYLARNGVQIELTASELARFRD